MRRVAVVLVLLICPFLQGCDLDQKVLPAMQEYFPGAELWKFNPQILWIETGASGVTVKFAQEMFRTFMAKPEASELPLAMTASGHRFLIIRFDTVAVIWDRQTPKNFLTADGQEQMDQWSTRTFGYRFSDVTVDSTNVVH